MRLDERHAIERAPRAVFRARRIGAKPFGVGATKAAKLVVRFHRASFLRFFERRAHPHPPLEGAIIRDLTGGIFAGDATPPPAFYWGQSSSAQLCWPVGTNPIRILPLVPGGASLGASATNRSISAKDACVRCRLPESSRSR